MKDMKLKELLPVGKIEPRTPIKETIDISAESNGVYVGVDDNDDVIFSGKPAGLSSDQLLPIIEALAKTKWFVKFVVSAAQRQIRIINMEFSNDGIRFK